MKTKSEELAITKSIVELFDKYEDADLDKLNWGRLRDDCLCAKILAPGKIASAINTYFRGYDEDWYATIEITYNYKRNTLDEVSISLAETEYHTLDASSFSEDFVRRLLEMTNRFVKEHRKFAPYPYNDL